MELTLSWNESGGNIFHYSPYGDKSLWNNGAQWWVSGFDSQTQNVKAKDLDATTIIDFSKMENGVEMFEAFRKATIVSKEWNRTSGWIFTKDYKAILTW